jgi:hypothetical protein
MPYILAIRHASSEMPGLDKLWYNNGLPPGWEARGVQRPAGKCSHTFDFIRKKTGRLLHLRRECGTVD